MLDRLQAMGLRDPRRQRQFLWLCQKQQQLGQALERIANGRFGLCTQCGQEISVKRLQRLPYVERCFACQRIHEQFSNP